MSRDGSSNGGCIDQIILCSILFYIVFTVGKIHDEVKSIQHQVERLTHAAAKAP